MQNAKVPNKNSIHPCKHFPWPQLRRSAKNIIGLTLKCQLKRYLGCHHVLLLLLCYLKFQAIMPLGTPNFHQMSLVTPGCKCQHANLPTCQHAYMPTCLHANMPSCQHAFMPTYATFNRDFQLQILLPLRSSIHFEVSRYISTLDSLKSSSVLQKC